MVAVIGWTAVIVAGIGALGSVLSAAFGAYVLRQIRTPSGDRLGAVVERTHDISHANNAMLNKLNGGAEHPE